MPYIADFVNTFLPFFLSISKIGASELKASSIMVKPADLLLTHYLCKSKFNAHYWRLQIDEPLNASDKDTEEANTPVRSAWATTGA